MDAKRLLTFIAISIVVAVGYFYVRDWLLKTTAIPVVPTQTPTGMSSPPAAVAPPATQSTTQVATGTIVPLTVSPATRAAAVELGSAAADDKEYALRLRLNPAGAGIDDIILNNYRAELGKDDRFIFQRPSGDKSETRPLTTRVLRIDGTDFVLHDQKFDLVESDARSAKYSLDIVRGQTIVARLTKRYEIYPRSHGSKGYEIRVDYEITNFTDTPMKVKTLFAGPTLPPMELERTGDRQVIAGYDKDGRVKLVHNWVEGFTEKKPTIDVQKSDDLKFLWAGTGSVYFNAIVRPLPIDGGKTPEHFEFVRAVCPNPAMTGRLHEVLMTFETAERVVNPRSILSMPMTAFMGPKDRAVLNEPYYADFPLQYTTTLETTSGCTFCTFSFIVNILVWLLAKFHLITQDWGLAIICLVVVVRLLLHPITKRAQINIQKMSKYTPELEKLKKKYEGDPAALQQAMMAFYKEHGVTQIFGCLPMFLQMPIWIALYASLQQEFALRQSPFLFGYTWIKDLARPDTVLTFGPIPIPFIGYVIDQLNILPLMLAVVFYLQQKYSPKPPAMTDEQKQQQKMMQWMSVLFTVFLYSQPSGLNLYILTSTTWGIIESKRIRDHIKAKDAAEADGKIIVDVSPASGPRIAATGAKKKAAEPQGFFAKVAARIKEAQERVEEMKREQAKLKAKDKPKG